MKELFHIEEPGSGLTKKGLLSIRIGEKHAGFAITDRTGIKLERLSYYIIEEWNPAIEEQLLTLRDAAEKVIVGYDFVPSILVDRADMNEANNDDFLRWSGNHDEDAVILTDRLSTQKLENIYAVPVQIHHWVKEKFPGAEFIHDFSVAIEKNTIKESPAELYVDFRANDFSVIVWKEKKLVQATRFPYSNPADVLFYLLRTYQTFSLSQSTARLVLSGLIDRQSTLFTELYQYFLPISFTNAGWTNSASYPPHFFGSFQNLATCAS